MLQTPPNTTAARIQSAEPLSGQMRYMERRYDDVLGKVLEQNALILKSVSRMQDDLKNLRSKLESLEISAAQEDSVTTGSHKINGVDTRLNENNLLLQGQQIGGGMLDSPASAVGSSLSALTSPFQQPPNPYYNPYPPIYNPYMMMPMSDPMGYFVNPTMQYAAMYAALGQHATSPAAPPPPTTTELPKVTPPPFSFGVQLPVAEESPASNKSTASSIFSQPLKTSPIVSSVLTNKVVEAKDDKTVTDFATVSSKMSSFGDLSNLAPSSNANNVPHFSFGIGGPTQSTIFPSLSTPTAAVTTTVTKSPATSTSSDVVDDLNENVLFQQRAKLSRYVKQTKEWKDSEIGDIKILQSKDDATKIRVIMTCEKVVCNHWVNKDFEFTNYQEQPKTLMWSALDFADLEEGPKIGIFVCKFGQEEQAKEFKKLIDAAMSLISQSSTTITHDKSTKVLGNKKDEAKPSKSLSELSPQATVVTTELPKSTPFSFGFKLPTSEGSPSIFSQPSATSPILSKLLTDKDEKTVAAPDFAALSSKMSGFGDLSKSTPPTTTTTANNSNLFSFGTGSVQPIFSSTRNSSASKSPANNPAHADEDVVEEFEPTVDFAPVIPLPPLVEVKKGDENENVLFQHRAKLLRYVKETKEWKERGIGDIKILQSKEDAKKIRVVMWREKVHKVVCNHWVTKDFAFTNYQEHSKSLMWTALDFAESEEGPKTEIFVCKFGQEEQAKEFKKQMELAVSMVSQSPTNTPEKAVSKTGDKPEATSLKPLSETFKMPEGQWNCEACYSPNNKDSIACAACAAPKPGHTPSSQEKVATELPKSTPFSFGFKFPTSAESPVPTNKQITTNIFSQTPTGSPILSKLSTDKGAGTKKDEPTVAPPDFAALSTKMCGFGDLTKTAPITTTTTANTPNPFSFGTGSIQPVFGSSFTLSSSTLNSSASKSPANNSAHADGDVVEEFEPTVDFAPVIPLPPLVEVKKGDENENVLFQHRAKLLRYVKETKEWKERGIGDIKILQSKEDAKKIRVVMWREKVHKVVCNHWVTKDFAFTNYQEHSKSLMWTALDFAESEEGPKTEIFVCKFGQEEQAKEFKKQIELAVSIVSQSPVTTPEKASTVSSTKKSETEIKADVKPLSEIFKTPEGQWNCTACYLSNSKDIVACAACGSSRPGASTTTTIQETSDNHRQHQPPCRGCDPDKFNFAVLDGREVPTFEDVPKPQRPTDSTKNETLKELLTKNTTINNNKGTVPQATDITITGNAGSGDASSASGGGSGVLSGLSSFSFSLPPSTTITPSTTATTGEASKVNVPTFNFNPNFTFSKENMSSIAGNNSIFGGGFSTIESTVPSTVDGLNNLEENGDEDYEDEDDETMFVSNGHVFYRQGSGDFQDMGEGQVKIVYDGEHYCARFNFISDTDEIEHFVATETTVTSTGDNTFEWDFINLANNENADKSRIRVIFPDKLAFDSFESTMSDSVDMAMQAGVTEADLRDEAAQYDE